MSSTMISQKQLVEIESREAERILAEQISAMAELRGARMPPVGCGRRAIRRYFAERRVGRADLIVMGAHRKQLLRDIFVGTTVERVIRTGPYPVLMVNNEAQRRYRNAMAAVDTSEPSANAIRTAKAAGMIGEVRATLLHAFLPLAKGKMFVAAADVASINEYVASERLKAMDELIAFLVANDVNREEWSLRVEEGRPLEVITRGGP